MVKNAILATLLVGAASAFSEAEYKNEFTNWMQIHEKSYTSEEFKPRYEHFKANMDIIEACNNNPEFTFTCGKLPLVFY